ncbi:hypothetical protein BH09BAC4_BH09BAC4_48080 [soil metagenome]
MKKGVWMMIAWLGTVGGSVWANDSTSWHQGELVLTDGVEWKGELAYNWKAEVVQCRQGAVIKAYSANQVRSFMYFDDQQNTIRRFLAIECPVKSTRRRTRLLEEVIAGPLVVYREPRASPDIIKVTGLSGFNTDEEKINDIDNFTYLVVANGELIPLDRFYRTVWPQMKTAFDKEIKKYASLIRANMSGTVGRLRLIYQYNYLVGQLLSQTLPEQDAVFSN